MSLEEENKITTPEQKGKLIDWNPTEEQLDSWYGNRFLFKEEFFNKIVKNYTFTNIEFIQKYDSVFKLISISDSKINEIKQEKIKKRDSNTNNYFA